MNIPECGSSCHHNSLSNSSNPRESWSLGSCRYRWPYTLVFVGRGRSAECSRKPAWVSHICTKIGELKCFNLKSNFSSNFLCTKHRYLPVPNTRIPNMFPCLMGENIEELSMKLNSRNLDIWKKSLTLRGVRCWNEGQVSVAILWCVGFLYVLLRRMCEIWPSPHPMPKIPLMP